MTNKLVKTNIYKQRDDLHRFIDERRIIIVNESDGADGISKKYEKIIAGMKIYTPEEIGAALKVAGFGRVTTYHHDSKPWITVIAEKGEAAKAQVELIHTDDGLFMSKLEATRMMLRGSTILRGVK